jgi:YbbR domain-containing protein
MIKNNPSQNNSWLVRIMALLIACILWVYVMNEQNPLTTRTLSVPLSTSNLAEDRVVKDLPANVNVKVSGPRGQVANMNEDSIIAYIDFTAAEKGRNTYNVQAKSSVGEVVEVSPAVLQLEVDEMAEKQMEIEPRIMGVPNSGVTVGKMDLSKTNVTIKGASSRIAEVGKVVVLVDISNRDKNFEDDAAVVAISKDGREMYDVKINPDKVHVSVVVLKQLGTNTVPVKPSLSGEVPPGFTIESIKVTPSTVQLTAEPSLLANIVEIKSAPIVLEKITGDVELKVPLNIPDKVLADSHNAIVEIKLKKLE